MSGKEYGGNLSEDDSAFRNFLQNGPSGYKEKWFKDFSFHSKKEIGDAIIVNIPPRYKTGV